MQKRFASIWFRHLTTDWMIRRQPELRDVPFVFAAPEHGRMMVKAASAAAKANGIYVNMVVADCRAILPALQVYDNKPEQAGKLLYNLAEWCLRYTPVVAVDPPDGLMLDISGCTHLWRGEELYLNDILTKLNNYGYDISGGIADTIGTAWAIARFGKTTAIIEHGAQADALFTLPPAALRIDAAIIQRLEKLGLCQIRNIINIPRRVLFRRFGQSLLTRLNQALGQEIEVIEPIQPIIPYQERLPSLEPIRTATGIEIALKKLLELLCRRFEKEGKGLRKAVFKCYRVDGNLQLVEIGTSRPSRQVAHLMRLFGIKIPTITPALGFELFILEAPIVEDMPVTQDALWHNTEAHDSSEIAELLDRVGGKVGMNTIHRYLPDEHYWPERSIKTASSLEEKALTTWRTDFPRPLQLLPYPEAIEVTVPIPDYPPMLFKYKGIVHNIVKADGPERLEQEWWLNEGLQRDYYCVEDENGARYWLFREGHYGGGDPRWFIHGFFA